MYMVGSIRSRLHCCAVRTEEPHNASIATLPWLSKTSCAKELPVIFKAL
jgi:hypothetical protein